MATFSVNDQARRAVATANGSNDSFSFSFQVNATTDVKVYVDGTLKTAGSHYDIVNSSAAAGLNTDGTGVAKFTGGNVPANNAIVTILSDVPVARTSVYTAGGNITATSLEADLDTLTMVVGDREERDGRALTAPVNDAADVDMTLPAKDTRKGTVLGFNATSGNPEAGPTIADVSSLSAITADIAALADIEDGTTATDAISGLAAIKTNVTTVAGISGNVTTVAGITSNISSVVSNASNINTVAGAITNVNNVGGSISNVNTVAGSISNVNALAASAVIADMALLATTDVIADMALLATTDVISDMNTLATSDIVSDLNTLATTDIVSDLNTLATADIVSDINTLATSDIVSDLNTLATSDIVSDINTLATSDIVSDLNTLATSDFVSDLNAVQAIASNVTSVAGNASNINSAVSNASNINTVAGAITNVNNVGGSIANVNTVASNISGVNSFAERYRVASSDPTSSLDEGDLAYNTTSNAFKFYNGSSWQSVNVSGIGSLADDSSPQLGGALDVQTHSIVSTSNRDITIDPNGTGDIVLDANVGIGTTPDRDLHVKGASGDPVHFKLEGDASDYARIMFDDGTTDNIGELRYNFGSDYMSFNTNSAERMRLTSAGLLGLGVSSPATPLEVFTNANALGIRLSTTGGNKVVDILNNGSSGAAEVRGYYNNNSGTQVEGFRLEASGDTFFNGGKVGIGTASPSEPLHVSATSGAAAVFERTNSASVGIRLLGNGMTAATAPKISAESGPDMAFTVNNGEAFRVDSSRNVLIGKTASNIATEGIELRANDDVMITQSGDVCLYLNRLSSDGNIIDFRKDGTTVGSIGIQSSGFYIDGESGHEGIRFANGAITPRENGSDSDGASDLGASNNRFKDGYFSGTVYSTSLRGQNDTDTGIDVGDTGSTADNLIFLTGGSERFRVNGSGHLNIGQSSTSSPGAGNTTTGTAIQSSGLAFFSSASGYVSINRNGDGTRIQFNNSGNTRGTITVTGTSTAYNTSSDRRLKSNIQDATSASAKIDAIQVRQFDWTEDGSHQDYGMIAQELKAIEPLAVSGSEDSKDMMGVDYSKLVPMLIKEIQQLRGRVAALEAS